MYNRLILFFLFLLPTILLAKDKLPKDGSYTYDIAFAEWGGRSLGADCIVVIEGDSITVLHNGGNLSGNAGEVIASGHIRKHKKSNQWIIATSPEDIEAADVGGCSDGPLVVDFKKKKVWLC